MEYFNIFNLANHLLIIIFNYTKNLIELYILVSLLNIIN